MIREYQLHTYTVSPYSQDKGTEASLEFPVGLYTGIDSFFEVPEHRAYDMHLEGCGNIPGMSDGVRYVAERDLGNAVVAHELRPFTVLGSQDELWVWSVVTYEGMSSCIGAFTSADAGKEFLSKKDPGILWEESEGDFCTKPRLGKDTHYLTKMILDVPSPSALRFIQTFGGKSFSQT